MVTAINTTTFIKDTVIQIKTDLASGVTDPISSSRPTGEKFVMTSYPQRATHYPLITVRLINVNSPVSLGAQSSLHLVTLPLEIRVWARNETEKDNLSQLVLNRLRSIQHTASTGTIQAGLFDFKMNSAVNVDENGEEGIKSRVLEVQYSFILGQ